MITKVKPLKFHNYDVPKVHVLLYDEKTLMGKPFQMTFCGKDAALWDRTNEKITCAVCKRLLSRERLFSPKARPSASQERGSEGEK